MIRPLCAALLLGASLARAAVPTVAVMPFKDLSGSSGAVGEAIRETVTTDLKDLSGLRVIERGNLDKVLAEQNLQSQRTDLDPQTAARVGKLLGATLICAGAYQKAAQEVRLTARFIRVESGEVVGTAKVDGRATDFLRLQDKISALLLEKAGLARHAKKLSDRAPQRPSVKSLNTIELYGQALLADNDDLRRQYLKLVVAEDADFTYAANDLAALERRMKGYQARADAARDQVSRYASEQLAAETDPHKVIMLMGQMFAGLTQSHRWRQIAIEARHLLDHPLSVQAAAGLASPQEFALMELVSAEVSLRDYDAGLRDGERFLKTYPASMYFLSVKSQMDRVIDERRHDEKARAELPQKLADVRSQFRADACHMGLLYYNAAHFTEAQRLLRTCLRVGPSAGTRETFWVMLILSDIHAVDWKAAHNDMRAFEHEDPDGFRSQGQGLEWQIPSDG